MQRTGAAVALRGVHHEYATAHGPLEVLRGLDLEIERGGYLAITGASGSGKSTLLCLLGGLERPQAGTFDVAGHDLAVLSGNQLAAYRRDVVGFVFQHFGLLDTLTAIENVELAATLAQLPRGRRAKRAQRLLATLGVGERADHRPLQLSGGERQRVAIARALMNGPALLLADEPTGNLDEDAADDVIRLLEEVAELEECTLVVVTHNKTVAARAPRCVHLDAGTLHE